MSAVQESVGDLKAALRNARVLLLRTPKLAADQAREILRVMPKQPDAELVLASALRRSGDFDAARALLNPLRQQHPRSAPVWLEWGELCARIGEDDIAARALRRAVDLEPAMLRGWLALADHCQATEDLRGAAEAYAQFLRHSTRDPELMKAADALCANRIPEAERLLRTRLYKAPTDVAAIRMMAEVAARLGRYEDAEHLLGRCLELSHSFSAARQQYAMLLHRNNKAEAALRQIALLLRDDPANAGIRNLKAAVLCRTGDYLPAIDIYRELIEQFPNQARLMLSYGHALKTAGRRDEAIAAYRRCAEIEPGFGEAFWSLANLKTVPLRRRATSMRCARNCSATTWTTTSAQFEFALGKALEDRGRLRRRVRALRRGQSSCAGSACPIAPDDASPRASFCEARIRLEFFAERAAWGDPRPIRSSSSGCRARDRP
jgi:tetratricopeptide (TPR) repeat protein